MPMPDNIPPRESWQSTSISGGGQGQGHEQQQQQKQKQKHDVNTSMETATTLGTQEEESMMQIEVEDLSILSAPRISTLRPSTTKASQPKPFPNSKPAGVSTASPSAPSRTKGGDETKRTTNAETTTVPTPAEKQTTEGDDPSYAMDSAQIFQDIAVAVKNTVASTLSGFVGDVMESTNHSRIPLSERVEPKDALHRPKGEMLDAIYVPTSSMKQWDCNDNDKDEDQNSDGENADSFPFLGSSISIADSLPSISLDLDASILSWDLDTVFEMDRTQSKWDLDAVLGGDLGQSKKNNDNPNPNPRQQQKQPTNNNNNNNTAEGSGSNFGDNSIARSGDSTLQAYNSKDTTESKIRRGKRNEVSKTNKSDKHDPQFPIFEDLPYRATKMTVKNQPVKERVVPNTRSAMENTENETNFPRVGRTESHQHPVGVPRASTESKSLHSQKTAAAVIGENEANDDDIRSIDSLPFHPIVQTPPKRQKEDQQGDWETIENSASTRRTVLSEKNVHQNPTALVRRTPPKPTERARGNESSISDGTKNQLPAPTKATGRIDFAASGRAGVKANESPNSRSSSSNNNNNNGKKNSNYVVDRNGFLVDTTTAVLEDLEKSFETSQQDTRKQGPSPSPQFGGDGKAHDHAFSPPAPYWKSMTKTDPGLAAEYRAGPVPSREKR